MGMPYIPIYFDWTETTETLDDAEKGRLVDAMVLYAKGEDWSGRISGNERYVFPAFRKMIDRSIEISAKRKQAGANGGKQSQANTNYSKWKQNRTSSTEEEKEKEEEEEKEKEGEKEYSSSRLDSFSRSYEIWRSKKNAGSL